MFDIIHDIINHTWQADVVGQDIIYYICGALIVLMTVVFIDLVYRVFTHFWSGGR